MIELPEYFVRKISGYPYGFRLHKMEKLVMPVEHNVFGPYPMTPRINTVYPRSHNGDPLNGGDFRYWKAYRDSDYCLTACRCCGSVFSYKEARKTHMSEGRCGAKLEEAYKRLKKTNICLICDVPTHQKAYGLPLCGKDCIAEWDYVTATPDKLGKILKEIGDR